MQKRPTRHPATGYARLTRKAEHEALHRGVKITQDSLGMGLHVPSVFASLLLKG